jgi:cullin 3
MQQSQEGERLLKAVHKVWSDHTDCMDKLSHILKYMVCSTTHYVSCQPPSAYSPQDRVYVKSANVLEVVELGRDLFVKHIVRPPIKDHVITAILSLLRIERDGFVINRSAVTNCVDALLQLSDHPDGISVYTRYLEPEILRQSVAYYKAEAERLLETCDTPEYLRRVCPSPFFHWPASLSVRTFRPRPDFPRKSHAHTSICPYKPRAPFKLFYKILSSHHTCKGSLTCLTRAWIP